MREVAEQSIGWLVLAGIVGAVLLARKRYKGKFEQEVAARVDAALAAHAEANARQSVNVAVDASHRVSGVDPAFEAAVLAVLRARGPGLSSATGWPSVGQSAGVHDDNDNDPADYYHVDGPWLVDSGTGGVVGELVRGGVGRAAGDRDTPGDVAHGESVEGVPCASLKPNGAELARRVRREVVRRRSAAGL